MIEPLGREARRFLETLKIEITYDSAIAHQGISPEKSIILKGTGTPMFSAALFPTARSWKQLKWPAKDEWIKKMWYLYTVEYYTATKRNYVGSFVQACIDLDTVIQSEVSQKEKIGYRI